MNITFENINTIGYVIQENELYKHYHYPEMLLRYDSNFIAFHRMPTLEKLMEAEAFLRDFHQKNGQMHVKFVFPQDTQLPSELLNYLNNNDYSTGYHELYGINPKAFPNISANPDILVEKVSASTFIDYVTLQYNQDVQYGDEFAKAKKKLLQENFDNKHVTQIIAYYKSNPIGAVDVILNEHTAEIDNLFVVESHQRKGIGSHIQKYVMDSFDDRFIILVADGDDTPKEMYQKQNYQYFGFQSEALRVYK